MTEGTVDKLRLGQRRIIERPRLTRMLDDSPARIKMLVAPAGYGKTTLARQWLAASSHPAAWYTATPSSVDVAALALGLHRTVSTAYPALGRVLLERLGVTANPQADAELLADVLADDLESWPETQWLVIDDYHQLAGAASAERFIEILLMNHPVRLLLLTRERPSWASARRILYGEIFEIGRELLAMTDAEAHQVLGGGSEAAAGLLKTSSGWPAAIALAAISPPTPQGITIATDLHRFFAEELYQSLDDVTRHGLWMIGLIAPETREVITRILGSTTAARIIEIANQQGFLTESVPDVVEIHPLLQQFLEDKLRHEDSSASQVLIGDAFRYFVETRLWDKAFDLIDRFDLPHLIPSLVKASQHELLAHGRTETLRRWLSRSREAVGDPAIGLMAAELAFREGHYYASEILAKAAAESPKAEPDTKAGALIAAGRAAHAASRESESMSLYIRAKCIETTPKLIRVAAMGELGAAIELELPKAPRLARDLASSEDLEPHERVVLAGRVLNLQACFSLPVDLDAGRAARQLLHLVNDPVARCSFRNVFGYALAACGQYEEALELTDDQFTDVERCRLEFVLPYALCVQALSHAGSRFFAKAEETLEEAHRLARRAGDPTAVAVSECLQIRLFISQGAFHLAFAHPPHTRSLTKSLTAELLASHALARAGAGETAKSLDLAAEAERISGASETSICVPAARSACALTTGDTKSAERHASQALRVALSTGMIESFVAAYRGCPELLVCLLQNKALHDDVNRLLALSGDAGNGARTQDSVLSLSPREKEVLALLGHGLTNIQIGEALFISPPTVKVHVSHILDKLGVKSRTEAALRAVQIGRAYAAPDTSTDSST